MTTLSYASLTSVKARLHISDSTDDDLLATIIGQVNAWLETKMQRQIGPIDSATYTFDGNGRDWLYIPIGIREVSALTIASGTGQTGVAETNYVILPRVQQRRPGWPGFTLQLTDLADIRTFYRGYGTVAVTMTAGWDAIPDDLSEVAEVAIVRAWAARVSGQSDVVGVDEMGNPVVSRYISGKDMHTINAYRTDHMVAA